MVNVRLRIASNHILEPPLHLVWWTSANVSWRNNRQKLLPLCFHGILLQSHLAGGPGPQLLGRYWLLISIREDMGYWWYAGRYSFVLHDRQFTAGRTSCW